MPTVKILVIDSNALAHDLVKHEIQDASIQKLLPFQTSIVEGENYFHIRNESLYPIATTTHVIDGGETLCAHNDGRNLEPLRFAIATCPGCVAKAKNIIATHLLSDSGIISE